LERARWGHGLGGAVLDRLLEETRNRNIPFVIATISKKNHASMALLLRRRFQPDETISEELGVLAFRRGGSHSSTRFPSGSLIQAKRPFASSLRSGTISTPAAARSASKASRSSTRKFIIACCALDPKYAVSWSKGALTVHASTSGSSCQKNLANPSLYGTPRRRRYHSPNALGSRANEDSADPCNSGHSTLGFPNASFSTTRCSHRCHVLLEQFRLHRVRDAPLGSRTMGGTWSKQQAPTDSSSIRLHEAGALPSHAQGTTRRRTPDGSGTPSSAFLLSRRHTAAFPAGHPKILPLGEMKEQTLPRPIFAIVDPLDQIAMP